MTITHGHRLLEQDLGTAPKAFFGQYQDVCQRPLRGTPRTGMPCRHCHCIMSVY
ncbi:BZ3500_MvSof-1268-A1-R1_Chr2-1g04493 [Microbotryum saponariae]|uniref:BZ3500_MvSof-1268-A1-R1_Chr2-1g04493 protein n=1 Tax=Microbotryum saponariae TaxID=289078 RepID=A0A2X0KJH0_9BASI|nr:BZ3500_MvSof-1268-A1-R1_Chr2-1g04493 [Microbotryum saponariae]SCZ91838.1 BZ3501_MvSof-1269-A2-R1_Chr2-1g04149 [Microbotryum saponariae]